MDYITHTTKNTESVLIWITIWLNKLMEQPLPVCFSWLEYHPINQRVMGLTVCQGTYIGFNFSPQSWYIQEATKRCFSHIDVICSLSLLTFLFEIKKKLIIFYWLCHYSCPDFSPLPPSTQHHPLPQAIPLPLFMSTGHAYKFFGYSISSTVLYITMAIL